MSVCAKCLEAKAIGRVNGQKLDKMSDYCLPCAKDFIRSGTCPLCLSGFDTVEHISCLAGDADPIVEPSLA